MIKKLRTSFARRRRFLYVARGGPALCKIGWSFNPEQRIRSARWIKNKDKWSHLETPELPTVVWSRQFPARHALALERLLKHLLQKRRRTNEWFDVPPAEAVALINKLLDELPSFTPLAIGTFLIENAPV